MSRMYFVLLGLVLVLVSLTVSSHAQEGPSQIFGGLRLFFSTVAPNLPQEFVVSQLKEDGLVPVGEHKDVDWELRDTQGILRVHTFWEQKSVWMLYTPLPPQEVHPVVLSALISKARNISTQDGDTIVLQLPEKALTRDCCQGQLSEEWTFSLTNSQLVQTRVFIKWQESK